MHAMTAASINQGQGRRQKASRNIDHCVGLGGHDVVVRDCNGVGLKGVDLNAGVDPGVDGSIDADAGVGFWSRARICSVCCLGTADPDLEWRLIDNSSGFESSREHDLLPAKYDISQLKPPELKRTRDG
jgi:hypothetical protein